MLSTILEQSDKSYELNEDFRDFMAEMPVNIWVPSSEEFSTSIQPYFPELSTLSMKEALDALGLPVIAQIGRKRFSMSASLDLEDAENQLNIHQQYPYPEIRQSLGIAHHWVIQVSPKSWQNSQNCMVEAHTDFEYYGRPPVCIINLP
jgi:hypothetical protein